MYSITFGVDELDVDVITREQAFCLDIFYGCNNWKEENDGKSLYTLKNNRYLYDFFAGSPVAIFYRKTNDKNRNKTIKITSAVHCKTITVYPINDPNSWRIYSQDLLNTDVAFTVYK
jgi:hypothetical protein